MPGTVSGPGQAFMNKRKMTPDLQEFLSKHSEQEISKPVDSKLKRCILIVVWVTRVCAFAKLSKLHI